MTPPGAQWCLVVPVKSLATAKTRLSDSWVAPGLTPAAREDLALAFAVDTVDAAIRCPQVRAVVVVTDDPRATRVLAGTGAVVVPDEPAAGLNAALRHGAAVAIGRHPTCGIGALSADLPALRPGELTGVLRAALRHRMAMVADMHGSGTTLLLARSLAMFHPSFGAESRSRHVAAGAVVVGADARSVRQDVDTLADLRAALGLGVGPATLARTGDLDGLGGAA
jgi:2-phospho-L-lactate guanylyltransferase